MNDLEKRSFYSFLSLYIISSFLFVSLVGYWYYEAQRNALENEMYYKLQHTSDIKSGDIIMAHMKGKSLKKGTVPEGVVLAYIDINGKIVSGHLIDKNIVLKSGYFMTKGYNVLISNAPREHLNIKYVVTQSNNLSLQLRLLKKTVYKNIILVIFLMSFIAWMLSKFFMKPVRQRVEQIERFINDVTHELNTPITSLIMSTKQALKKEECTQKTLNNISISTKQLYDIYSSLTYLNFKNKNISVESIDIQTILEQSIIYYNPLAELKRISFRVELESYIFFMSESQAKLLFGNLIGNAIKYSSPHSIIKIRLKENIFTIQDEGIGIELSKQKEIFKKFNRATEYSGGFGIGLSIVKSICEEYDIKIELDSVPKKGTKVTLRF